MAAISLSSSPYTVTKERLDDLLSDITSDETPLINAFGLQSATTSWGDGIPKGKILDRKTHKLRDMTNREKADKFLKEAVEGKEPYTTVSGAPTLSQLVTTS